MKKKWYVSREFYASGDVVYFGTFGTAQQAERWIASFGRIHFCVQKVIVNLPQGAKVVQVTNESI